MSNTMEQTIFVCNLIEAVREHRCLYDKKDSFYFNRRQKEKAWLIIGKQLGKSDVACHRRWKLLREKFAKELKKRDRALKNGESFQSDWNCFNNIMYIEDHIAPRRKNDRLPLELVKSETPKPMVYEHAPNADTTTEKQPFCSTGLEFLAQFSKATLQATHLTDSNDFSSSTILQTTKMEMDDSQKDGQAYTDSNYSASSSSDERPTLKSNDTVETILKALRSNKEMGLTFVKNLTNALKINNMDVLKDDSNENDFIQKPPAINDPTFKDEVVRDTLLRVNGMNNLASRPSNENLSMEVTSSGYQPNVDLRDEIFGKMVVTMLADITDEECKDDAKFGIMQVLINARRACRHKQLTGH